MQWLSRFAAADKATSLHPTLWKVFLLYGEPETCFILMLDLHYTFAFRFPTTMSFTWFMRMFCSVHELSIPGAKDGVRSAAKATFIHEVAFYFRLKASSSASLMEMGLHEFVSLAVTRLMLVKDWTINHTRDKSSSRSNNLFTDNNWCSSLFNGWSSEYLLKNVTTKCKISETH